MKKNLGSRRWLAVAAAALMAPAICSAAAFRETFTTPVSLSNRQAAPTKDIAWYSMADRFLFTGAYYVNLSVTEMRIDHVAYDSRCTRRNRNFMISASLAQPIGNDLFSGRMEVPFLAADRLKISRLIPASVGDYVVHLNNAPILSTIFGLSVTARF